MSGKSIKKNYIYNVAYQVLQMIVPLITAPYISRVLGAEAIGEYSFAQSVVSYFVLFATMGINLYGQREISYVQNDKAERSRIFWETKCLTVINVIFCSIFYFIFLLVQGFSVLYIVLYINILAVAMDVTWFFQGLEEFKKIVLRNTVLKLINVVYTFVFVKSADDLIVYALGLAGITFVGNLSLWPYLKTYLNVPKLKSIRPFRNIKVVLSLFVPTVAIEVYTVLDKTMIGLFAEVSSENGYYSQAITISRMVLSIVTSLGTVMIPRIGYYFGQGEYGAVRDYMYRAYRFVWFLGIPLCFGLMGVAYSFVPWFFGPGYDKVVPLLMVLSFLILAIGINNVTGMQYLIPTKRQNLFTLTVIIGAIVNFVLNLILIPQLYSIGAAIASVIAETVIAVVQLIIVRKEISVKKVVLCGWHYYVAGVIMLILLFAEKRYLESSIINTLIMVVSGATVYFGILIFMKDEFLFENMKKVLSKFGNKV